MKIKLEKFISKKAAANLRKPKLHKIAAIMENAKGENINEVDLPTAVALIGKKAYLKTASFKHIARGLLAMQDVIGKE